MILNYALMCIHKNFWKHTLETIKSITSGKWNFVLRVKYSLSMEYTFQLFEFFLLCMSIIS